MGSKYLKKEFPDKLNLIVADTETIKGDPYSIQLYDGKTMLMSYQKDEDILKTLIDYCVPRMKKDAVNLCYFHFLSFDLPVILHKYHKLFIENEFELTIKKYNVSFEVFCGKFVFANMETENGTLCIYDSYRFVMCSLEKAGINLNLKRQKMERPHYLGEREPTKKERPYFEEYSKADVYTLYDLGVWIVDRAREYNTPIPLSIAQFAAMVLRKKFFKEDDILRYPPKKCVIDSILSYHGGKNGLYINTPTKLKHIYSYDIISAYPWAMVHLPSFLDGEYHHVDKFNNEYEGIYCVDADYNPCKYNLLYDHTFNPIHDKEIKETCITSYELRQCFAYDHINIKKISGWIWKPSSTRSPLKDYVYHFFKMKQESKNETEYWIAKYLLNSLYGKFIQSTDFTSMNILKNDIKDQKINVKPRVYKAGGLFNPFIGSLITGAVRSKLHDLEHKYQSIHTSTDSIFTKKVANIGNELGDLKLENEGELLLVRNKLYVHYDKKKKINKYALHGFQSTIDTLLKLHKNKRNDYKISRMVRLKESFKNKNLKLKPLMFHDFDKTLNVNWKDYYEE